MLTHVSDWVLLPFSPPIITSSQPKWAQSSSVYQVLNCWPESWNGSYHKPLRSGDVFCQRLAPDWWDLVFVFGETVNAVLILWPQAAWVFISFLIKLVPSVLWETNVAIKTSFLLLANGNKESCLRSAQTRLSRGRQSPFGCIRLPVVFFSSPPSVTDLSVVTWISFIFTDRRWQHSALPLTTVQIWNMFFPCSASAAQTQTTWIMFCAEASWTERKMAKSKLKLPKKKHDTRHHMWCSPKWNEKNEPYSEMINWAQVNWSTSEIMAQLWIFAFCTIYHFWFRLVGINIPRLIVLIESWKRSDKFRFFFASTHTTWSFSTLSVSSQTFW